MKKLKQNKIFIKVSIAFIILIIAQFIYIEIENDNWFEETRKNAFIQLENENIKPTSDLIERTTKQKFINESNVNLQKSRLRSVYYEFTDYEKKIFITDCKLKLEQNEKDYSGNKELLKLEIDVMNNGYSFKSFIMEHILKFNSPKQLRNQNSYFYILTTFLVYIIYVLYYFLSKNKFKKN